MIDQEGKRLPKPKACPPEIYRIMLHCWSHRENDRPTFAALTEFLRTVQLEVLKATQNFEEPDRLPLKEGDEILVIDGVYVQPTKLIVQTEMKKIQKSLKMNNQ